jgi:hypothetical protein
MSIVELPGWRIRRMPDRVALRMGLASSRAHLHVLNKPEAGPAPLPAYCDRCATVIASGAVLHGSGLYCSVECSLEGPVKPA